MRKNQIKNRRLSPKERPERIPTTRVVVDKKAKASKRCSMKSAARKEIKAWM